MSNWSVWQFPHRQDVHLAIPRDSQIEALQPPWIDQPPGPYVQPFESFGDALAPIAAAVPDVSTWFSPVDDHVLPRDDANLYGESLGEGIHVVIDPSPDGWLPPQVEVFWPSHDPNIESESYGEPPFIAPVVTADVSTWFVVPPEYQPEPYDTNLFCEHFGGPLPDIATVVADLDTWFVVPPEYQPVRYPNVGPATVDDLVWTAQPIGVLDSFTGLVNRTDSIVGLVNRTDSVTGVIS